MDTMTGTIPIPVDAMLALLNCLSRQDRLWLAEQMTAQIEREKAETVRLGEESFARKEDDNARLEAFLSRISGDWGGDRDPVEIANELRQGAEMVRDVEAW